MWKQLLNISSQLKNMEIDKLIRKGNASIFSEWIKKHADKEFADLLDKAEEENRKRLRLR